MIPSTTSTYAYDVSNTRIKEVVVASTSTVTTHYPTKYYNITSGTPTKHVFVNGAVIATIIGTGASSTVSSVLTDHLTGSGVVTNASGTIIEATDYYPYGGIRVDERTGFNEQRKFAGHEYDDATGLSYMQARYYDQDIGKWISLDPASRDNPGQFLLDPQQLNGYSYARNNPLALFDPTGEKVEIVSKAIEANSFGTHVFLLITPDNPSDFGVREGANWTVGAYAGNEGNLEKRIDAPSDRSVADKGYSASPSVGYLKERAEVQRPEGLTDTEFINGIMERYNAYGDDAKYDAFVRNGYNSNSFVSGLLKDSGAELPWGGNAKGIDPGYGQGIPNNYIKADGQMAPSGWGAVSGYAAQQGSHAGVGAIQNTFRALQDFVTKLRGE